MHVISVNASADGEQALLQLSGGDMRRVLNLLQSTSMAYDLVNEENVYLTAGAALPKVIEKLLIALFSNGFEESYRLLLQVMTIPLICTNHATEHDDWNFYYTKCLSILTVSLIHYVI